jgi:hypothetical protein
MTALQYPEYYLVTTIFRSSRRITENNKKIKQIPDNQILSGIYFFSQITKGVLLKYILGE